MQYFKPFSDDEDDIDRLFRQLQTVEPPPSFVSRMLAEVSVQSSPSTVLFSHPVAWDKMDSWVIRDRRLKLC